MKNIATVVLLGLFALGVSPLMADPMGPDHAPAHPPMHPMHHHHHIRHHHPMHHGLPVPHHDEAPGPH
jgi:Spy/CpxP family protein refolding chaperone